MKEFAELEVVFVECNTGRMTPEKAWEKLAKYNPENVALVDADTLENKRIYFLVPAYDSNPLAIPAADFKPENATSFPDDHQAMSFARTGR